MRRSMGRALVRAIADSDGAELAGALEAPGSELIGKDAGVLAGLPANGIKLSGDLWTMSAEADGILELGDSDRMEALIEVYESDIARVRQDQAVEMTSENGGFAGVLHGTVHRISPQVRQREVLSTDPTGDADARIVEVRVRLDPASIADVRNLTGMKVIARLKP